MTVQTIDIRGKQYVPVAERVRLFREQCEGWAIITDLVQMTDDFAVIKATINNAESITVSTGFARCDKAGARQAGGRFLEKAETSAIGRALANLGYGSAALLADEDAEYIADSPVDRKPATNPEPSHWSEEPDFSWKKFWAYTKNTLNLTEDEVHAALGVDSVKSYPHSKDDAQRTLEAAAKAKAEKAAAKLATPKNDNRKIATPKPLMDNDNVVRLSRLELENDAKIGNAAGLMCSFWDDRDRATTYHWIALDTALEINPNAEPIMVIDFDDPLTVVIEKQLNGNDLPSNIKGVVTLQPVAEVQS